MSAETSFRPPPRLLAGDERALIRMAQEGDREALAGLVSAHMGFVVSLARLARASSLPLEDRVQEGLVGLLEAVRAFDLARQPPVRLVTFAKSWIGRDIRRASARDDHRFGGVRLPEGRYHAAARLTRADRTLRERLGRAPSIDELAREAGLPPEVTRSLREVQTRRLVLIDPPRAERDDGRRPPAYPLEVARPSLLEGLLQEEAGARLRVALAKLPAAQARLLRRRYGFDEDLPAAEVHSRGTETASLRALHARALDALRRLMSVAPAPGSRSPRRGKRSG